MAGNNGLPAQMKLAAFGVQTLFYGVYLTLTALIVYLGYRFPSPHAAASKAHSAIFNWYANVLFALVVTAVRALVESLPTLTHLIIALDHLIRPHIRGIRVLARWDGRHRILL